jgi:hemerythrin superfamily protein
MDPTTVLQKQHRAVEKLFKQAERTEDPSERAALVREIVGHLDRHTRCEEEIFYPAVREVGSAKAEDMILEAYEEHHVVKTMMRELCDADSDDERFAAKVTVLKELVQHHVEEEEAEMFKLAKKLGRDQLAALGDELASMAGEDGGPTSAGRGQAAKTRRRVA